MENKYYYKYDKIENASFPCKIDVYKYFYLRIYQVWKTMKKVPPRRFCKLKFSVFYS